jgi:hypothetical protein
MQKQQSFTLALIALSISLRLVLFFSENPFHPEFSDNILKNDEIGYDKIAVSITQDARYVPKGETYLSALRTPGYPVYLAFFYFLTDYGKELAIFFQIMMDAVIVYILVLIPGLLWQQTNYFAALLYAIDPIAAVFANHLLSDTLFTFVFVSAFYFFLRFRLNQNWFDFVLFTTLASVLALIRPIGVYFYLFILIVIVYQRLKKKQLMASHIVVFALAGFLFAGSWVIRNKMVHDAFFLSISGDYNAMILYALPTYGIANDLSHKEAMEEVLEDINSKGISPEKPGPYYALYKDKAFATITANPGIFAKTYFWGIIDMYFSIANSYWKNKIGVTKSTSDITDKMQNNGLIHAIAYVFQNSPWPLLLLQLGIILLFLFEYILAMAGIAKLVKERQIQTLILIGTPIIFFTLLTGPAGLARFKLTVIPFYLMLIIPGTSFIRNFLLKFRDKVTAGKA